MKTISIATSRQTKYVQSVLDTLQSVTHATNLELLQEAQKLYPEVSATTIHRVSARLKERGLIGCAPKEMNGSECYDTNPKPHHHFMCVKCGSICDVPDTAQARAVIDHLKDLSSECALAGTLTMRGVCKRCAALHK